ncbi:hypothetical protein EDB80DRAFT_771508 [Ilyonectria destructans]|nr:hypothetical protein EDB80DRAFT_771508 [Ilyonectria destructans]
MQQAVVFGSAEAGPGHAGMEPRDLRDGALVDHSQLALAGLGGLNCSTQNVRRANGWNSWPTVPPNVLLSQVDGVNSPAKESTVDGEDRQDGQGQQEMRRRDPVARLKSDEGERGEGDSWPVVIVVTYWRAGLGNQKEGQRRGIREEAPVPRDERVVAETETGGKGARDTTFVSGPGLLRQFPGTCCRAPDDFPLRRLEASTNAQPEGDADAAWPFGRLAGLAAGGTAGKLGTGIGKRVQGEGRGVAWNVESGTRDMGYEQGLRTWATDMGYGHGTWNTLTLCFVSQKGPSLFPVPSLVLDLLDLLNAIPGHQQNLVLGLAIPTSP